MMSLNEIKRIVAEHAALPRDRRVFHDPPKIEIPQHCIECGQDIDSFLVGWELLREVAAGDDGLPVRIGAVCDGCQTICLLCGGDNGHTFGCTEARRRFYQRNASRKEGS